MDYKTLSSQATIKGVNLKDRIVEGYGSIFDNLDSDGDVIRKGAYKKTLQENGITGKNRIPHVWQHDIKQPLGKFRELYEDNVGLAFKSFIPDTRLGNDVLNLYDAGIIKEHSVGFEKIKFNRIEKNGYEIKEIKLWEVSSVTLAANELAGMKNLKGLERVKYLDEEIALLSKAIKSGSFTDDTFVFLADKLDMVQKQYKDLFETLKSSQDTYKPSYKSIIDKYTLKATKFRNYGS